MAHRLERSYNTVYYWKTGRFCPREIEAGDIAKRLNVSARRVIQSIRVTIAEKQAAKAAKAAERAGERAAK